MGMGWVQARVGTGRGARSRGGTTGKGGFASGALTRLVPVRATAMKTPLPKQTASQRLRSTPGDFWPTQDLP